MHNQHVISCALKTHIKCTVVSEISNINVVLINDRLDQIFGLLVRVVVITVSQMIKMIGRVYYAAARVGLVTVARLHIIIEIGAG